MSEESSDVTPIICFGGTVTSVTEYLDACFTFYNRVNTERYI